ncbi:TetR/AcrR family transcriptional regulator [Caldimonas sp. KR1-144]|uniref:TetR/AcrR family transcriptional regulator n=1 Tax=Caldimonas sp. KR1-144 TaxID=3400911 RepID=UPI003BFEF211
MADPISSKGIDSRARMIDAAILLMRHGGLSAAGINEIVKASGAPKGSVYHFFPQGKTQLAREALAEYSQRLLAVFEQGLRGGRTPGGKVRSVFRLFAQRLEDGEFRQSCAAGAVCLDLGPDLETVREVIATAFSAWIELLAGGIGFEDRRRARSFAGLMLTAIEGAGILGRAEHSSRSFIEAGQWLGELADREASRGAAG